MRIEPAGLSSPIAAAAPGRWRAGAPWAAMALIALFSLWLNQSVTIEAWGENWWDERWFVEVARYLARGQWLGVEYGPQTLSKGPVYPMFMAVNFYLGLPLKTAEHLLYLASAGLLGVVAMRLVGRWPGVALFALLALNPVQWVALQRVLRENIYGAEALLLFALAARMFLVESGPLGRPMDGRPGWPLGLGLAFAAYWLTREEGVWLLPSLGLMLAYWLGRRALAWRRGEPRPPRWLLGEARYLLLPLAVVLLAIALVNTLNWARYGVWRSNDFAGSGAFVAAYGAVTRIETDQPHPRYLFTKEARRRAYQVSPAMRELESYFESGKYLDWAKSTCTWTAPEDAPRCDEVISGWLPWVLRDAVKSLDSHYRTARGADAYFRRLAAEINTACDAGAIPCLPPRATLMPPVPPGWEWPARILSRLPPALIALAGFGGGYEPPRKSSGQPESLSKFEDITHGPLAPRLEPEEGLFLRGWIVEPSGRADVTLERRAGSAAGPEFERNLQVYPRRDVGLQWPARGFIITSNLAADAGDLVIRLPDKPPIVLPLSGTIAPGTRLLDQPELVLSIDAIGPAKWGADLWMTWQLDKLRQKLIKWLARLYAWGMPLLVVAAVAGFILALGRELRRRRLSAAGVLAAALLGAALLRVGLLAYIDATSFHVLETHYMSPAHPLLLAFIAVAAAVAAPLLSRKA